jgi:hypothetical protein
MGSITWLVTGLSIEEAQYVARSAWNILETELLKQRFIEDGSSQH